MVSKILTFGLTASCVLWKVKATASCYWPNAERTDSDMVPCFANGTASMCCSSLDACSTSGWCLGSSGYIYRGACTDSSWQSSACLTYCRDLTNSYENFLPCTGDVSGVFSTTFCCSVSDSESCCSANYTVPSYFTGRAFAPGDFEVDTSDSSSTSASSQTSSTSSAHTSSTPACTPANCPSAGSGYSAVGVAVGVPLGAVAVGVLTFLIWWARGHRGGNVQGLSQLLSLHDVPMQEQTAPMIRAQYRDDRSAQDSTPSGYRNQTYRPEYRNELPVEGYGSELQAGR